MQKHTTTGKKTKSRGSLLVVVLAALLFLAGAAVFLYPTVSNWLAEIHQSDVIQEYEKKLATEDEDFYAAEWQRAREYNDSLVGDPVHDPFIPGTGYALPDNYLECLNIDGMMGYIEIPKIGVCLPIYHGTSEEVLQEGVGHIESTTLPIGGNFTHAVLTGHRGLPNAKLFTDLDQLDIGDQFYLYILDEVLAYEVDEINTVLPDELQELRAIEGRDLVTLITCTPYGVNTHRLLVRGTRIPYVPEKVEEYRQSVGLVSILGLNIRLQYLGAAAGGLLLLTIIVVIFLVRRRRKKEERMQSSKKKKKSYRLLSLIAILLFLAGLIVLLYPVFTNWIYGQEVEHQKQVFEQQIEDKKKNMSDTDTSALPFEELYQELKRRNEELFLEKQTNLKDPFSYQQPGIDLLEYGLEGNIIGFISIPKMKVELPILLGANTTNMREGAVHLTETSYPIGGENTNCVIAAHRGYNRTAMFRDIEKLEIGDEIFIRNFRETLIYRVTELQVISPTDVQELLIQEGRDLVTLITCHPYRHNYQRYVVYCERVHQ